MAHHKEFLVRLYEALRDLVHWLEATKVPGIIIGAVATALLGRPRITRDVDAVILLGETTPEDFLDAGRRFGFVPRLPDVLAFAQQSRVLLLRHEPSGVDVDISLGALPFEQESIARSERRNLADISLPLPTAEDLIIMKAVAHRAIDLHDVDGLLAANPSADLERVRHWVGEFSRVLDMPEILDDLERIVKQRLRAR